MKIRDLSQEDLEIRVAWMNNPRVNSTLNIQLPISLDSTKLWFSHIVENPNRFDFSFEEDGELVAMGGFTGYDKENKKAELYIFVSPELQGRGIGTRALDLMCDYGFRELGFNKIELYANADNLAAIKLYERHGFVMEDFQSNVTITNGKVKDRCFYTLFKK